MGDIKKFTTEEVAKHNVLEGPNKSTWVIYEGAVYDITKFVSEHPGGTEVLSDTAGTDITRSFTEIGHSDHARGLMKPMKLGEIVRTRRQGPIQILSPSFEITRRPSTSLACPLRRKSTMPIDSQDLYLTIPSHFTSANAGGIRPSC
jgi:cytochrome b involved in lipid metabolism